MLFSAATPTEQPLLRRRVHSTERKGETTVSSIFKDSQSAPLASVPTFLGGPSLRDSQYQADSASLDSTSNSHDTKHTDDDDQSATNSTGFLVIFCVIALIMLCGVWAAKRKSEQHLARIELERRLERERTRRQSDDWKEKQRLKIKAKLQTKLYSEIMLSNTWNKEPCTEKSNQKSVPAQENDEATLDAPRVNNLESASLENPMTLNNSNLGGMATIHNESCPICLVEFQPQNRVTFSAHASCPHNFHHDCLSTWLLKTNECPCCRQDYLDETTTSDEPAIDANTIVMGQED